LKYTDLFMEFTSLATTIAAIGTFVCIERSYLQVEEKALLHSVEVQFFSRSESSIFGTIFQVMWYQLRQ